MQPIRQIFHDAPKSIPVPKELQHCSIEMILWPLKDSHKAEKTGMPKFNIADVERIEIPTREERNARG